MDAETEKRCMAGVRDINFGYWENDEEHKETKRRLIEQCGSKQKAVEHSFEILWGCFLNIYKTTQTNQNF